MAVTRIQTDNIQDIAITTAKVADDAVTYAKLQNISATDRLLGRSTAGAGDTEEIVCTAFGRSLIDDAAAVNARTTLGLVIGTDVQAFDAELAAIAGLTSAANKGILFTGVGTATTIDISAFALTFLDDAAAGNVRTTLGLGTMATQDASAVAITGGTIVGTTIDGVNIKSYVDGLIQGLKWKQSVRAATTAAGTLATSFENGDVIDGVTLVTGNRILIKNQAAPADNGIYTVNASGAPTRATDADLAAELSQATVAVEEGTVNKDLVFVCTTDNPITLNTTALTWVNALSTITGALLAANNLSDLLSASTARTNLGLGTAAVEATGTSGHTIPFLDGANSWSGAQTFLNSSGIKILDTNASHTLGIIVGTDITANRTLTITPGDVNRTLTFTADATIGGTTSGTNTGDQTITLTGDVTGSGTGSFAATIANDAVTFAKFQNINTARLLGRTTASAGDVEEISVGAGLTLSAGVLNTSGTSLSTSNFVFGEVPSGTVNGVNDTFTLANTPTAGTVQVYKNTMRQKAGSGNDYTISGTTITFEPTNIPQTGNVLLVDYLK